MAQTHDGTPSLRTHAQSVRVLSTADQVVAILLDEIRALLADPNPVLGLATGNTFQPFFDALVAEEAGGRLSFERTVVTHLDEWVGLPLGEPGGMATEIHDRFLSRLRSGVKRFIPVPASPADVPAVDEIHEAALRDVGGVSLQLLGLGQNGHVAFNEPGTDLSLRTHTTSLDQGTMEANASRFASKDAWPSRARTLGPKTILEARRVVLVALGAKKAEPVRAMLEGPISSACPASCIRSHANALILLDSGAASLLSPKTLNLAEAADAE